MKRRIINAVITKKFNEWTATIEDEAVRKLVEKNTTITGGCIASMINGEEVKDYDVYFTNQETVLAVARYYIDKFKTAKPTGPDIKIYLGTDFTQDDSALRKRVKEIEALQDDDPEKDQELLDFYAYHKDFSDPGRVFLYIKSCGIAAEKDLSEIMEDSENPLDESLEDPEKKEKYRPVFFSSNAITLSDKVQIVTRFYGDAAEIHKNFDYLHATNYWVSDPGKVEIKIEALEAVHNKELIYVGSKYPVCSLFRMRKFISRGFTISASEILKIAMNINEFDLTKIPVLRDQLIGVDSAYFNSLIEALKEKKDGWINRNYVTELINRMYN
ncbi:hypothetical protein AGMMS49944_03680 [Spirochaetia bacterium]|nr:hypothetical protein AGMMS49944_03680 [Spirochaetia bacterium]